MSREVSSDIGGAAQPREVSQEVERSDAGSDPGYHDETARSICLLLDGWRRCVMMIEDEEVIRLYEGMVSACFVPRISPSIQFGW